MSQSSFDSAYNSTGLNGTLPDEPFYASIAGAVAVVHYFNPGARPLFIDVPLAESIIPKMEIVFNAYPDNLIMRLNGRSWCGWSAPEKLPSHYGLPPDLKYFIWSNIHMGIREARSLMEAKGISYGRWTTVSIFEESEPTQQVYYRFLNPRGGDYKFVRVGTRTKEVIVDTVGGSAPGRLGPADVATS